MAISTGSTATASDMTALLAAVKTLFSNRGLTVNNQTLSTMLTSYNPTFTAGASMAMNYGGDLFNKILIVNNIGSLKYSASGHRVLADGTTTEVLNWINTYKDKTGQDSAHGCRGACIGLCVGGCYGTADGKSKAGSCYCGTTCTGWCSGGSQDDCQTCDNICKNRCSKGCTSSCGHSGCSSGCYGGCSSGCQTTCTDTCATDCNTTCYTNCSGTSTV